MNSAIITANVVDGAATANSNVSQSSTVSANVITGGVGPQGPVGDVSTIYKQLAADPDTIISGAITRDSNDAATSAPVVWPDGTTGTYTATTLSSSFPGAVDAYTITYGSTRTYTQSLVTRNSDGAVTNRPAITVA